MEKGQLWITVIVTLVVAVIASVVTSSITGNVVKVPSYTSSSFIDIYTKAEVDTKISNLQSQITSLSDRVAKLEGTTQTTQNGCSGLNSSIIEAINVTYSGKVTLKEGDKVYYNNYVVLPSGTGYLLKVSSIVNQSVGYSLDKVIFTDAMSGSTYQATLTSEGIGTVAVGGMVYTVNYYGASSSPSDQRYVTIDFPQTTGPIKMTFYC